MNTHRSVILQYLRFSRYIVYVEMSTTELYSKEFFLNCKFGGKFHLFPTSLFMLFLHIRIFLLIINDNYLTREKYYFQLWSLRFIGTLLPIHSTAIFAYVRKHLKSLSLLTYHTLFSFHNKQYSSQITS